MAVRKMDTRSLFVGEAVPSKTFINAPAGVLDGSKMHFAICCGLYHPDLIRDRNSHSLSTSRFPGIRLGSSHTRSHLLFP